MSNSLIQLNKSDLDQSLFTEIPVYSGVRDNGSAVTYCNLWDVHRYLEIGRKRTAWAQQQIEDYEFVEGIDYVIFHGSQMGTGIKQGFQGHSYFCSVQMAKEICMVSRTPKGKMARRYFIHIEEMAQEAAKQSQNQSQPVLNQSELQKQLADLNLLALQSFEQVRRETDRANYNYNVAINFQQQSVELQNKVITQTLAHQQQLNTYQLQLSKLEHNLSNHHQQLIEKEKEIKQLKSNPILDYSSKLKEQELKIHQLEMAVKEKEIALLKIEIGNLKCHTMTDKEREIDAAVTTVAENMKLEHMSNKLDPSIINVAYLRNKSKK